MKGKQTVKVHVRFHFIRSFPHHLFPPLHTPTSISKTCEIPIKIQSNLG